MRVYAKFASLILLLISLSDLSSEGSLEKLSDAPYNPALFALARSYSAGIQYSESDTLEETGLLFSMKTNKAGSFSLILKGRSHKETEKQDQEMESQIIYSHDLRTVLVGISIKPAITTFKDETDKKRISAGSDIGLCMPVFDENLICLSVSDIAYTEYYIRSRSLQVEYLGRIISGISILAGISSEHYNKYGNVYCEMHLKPGKIIGKFPDFMCASIGTEKGINGNNLKTLNLGIEFYMKGYFAGLKHASNNDNKYSFNGFFGIDF